MSDTSTNNSPPRIAVITCAVIEDEVRHYAAEHDHIVHIELLEQGLHNEPDKLRMVLQEAIDRVEANTTAEAIVLGYGLCSRGTEGVKTSRCQLVIAHAHDCITLLLGCKKRYADYVAKHPGTYWYSPGWNKCHIPPGKDRYDKLYNEYLEKYGEENAKYLMEQEQGWFNSYDRATYVDLTVGATDADVQYTKDCAEWLGWNFDRQSGDPALIRDLLGGKWEDDDAFVVLQPNQTFTMTSDQNVIEPVD